MMQDFAFGITDVRAQRDLHIVTENLSSLHTRMGRMLDCSYIHTQALAELLARAYVQDRAKITAMIEQYLPEAAAMELALPTHAEQIALLYRQMSTAEQIYFFRALLTALVDHSQQHLTDIATQLLGHTEPIEPTAHGRIVYQHNIYADEAFLHFSRVLPIAKACYSDSFTGMCEQLASGECEYCILPLENTQDGKLVRFYSLIERYELKIVLQCTVTAADNRHSTVFGLCRRGSALPALLVRDRSCLFEFLFWQENEHLSLSGLLHAAECASLSLVRVDCLPRSDDEILMGAGYPFDVCFEVSPAKDASVPGQDLLAFLMYLSIHAPSFLPLGIYQHV
jgi:hypothetical protein